MPKSVPCPVCRSKVKVPADAEAGDSVTCPDCDETFTPPHLRPKGPSVEDEESYEIHESRDEDDFDSAERTEKRRKARAIQIAGRQRAEDLKEKRPPLFGALDIVFLIIVVAAALGVTIGMLAAKKAPSTGVMVVIILGFCLMMFLFAYRKILMRK